MVLKVVSNLFMLKVVTDKLIGPKVVLNRFMLKVVTVRVKLAKITEK